MHGTLVPGAVERPVFYSLPVWLIVAFYLAAAAALAFFFYDVYRKVRKYRLGRSVPQEKLQLRRIVEAVFSVLLNRTVFRGDIYAGIAHILTLWGFVVLFIVTLIVLVDNDILRPLMPRWRFFKGDFYLIVSGIADFFGVLLVVGLLLLIIRRGFFRLAKLRYQPHAEAKGFPPVHSLIREDWSLVLLFLVVGIGGFACEAMRIGATGEPPFETVSFVGWGLNRVFAAMGVSSEIAHSMFAYFWLFHAVTALALIVYIPRSKAWHMLAGWFSLAIKPESPGEGFASSLAGKPEGYTQLKDFTRGELFTLDACIRCGRCHEACPAASSGFPLSPRDLILALRYYADRTSKPAISPTPPNPGEPAPDGNPGETHAMVGDIIPSSWLWACTTCFACDDICPLGIQHIPFIVQMRRSLVARGDVDNRLQDALMNLQRYGNSLGKSPRQRPVWSLAILPALKDARKEAVEYLWVTGDYASYDPRVQEITRATARLFRQGGLDIGLLYDAEQNAGNDVRRVGEEGLFEMLMEKNRKAFAKAKFQKVVTTDPHTYHVLRHEYNWGNGDDSSAPEVLHHTEILESLLQSGRLSVQNRLNLRATFHDPCYLGRWNGVYDAPRRVLKSLGVDLVEMPRHRDNSYCCGAGGGHIWMEDTPGITERPAESRVKEAASLPGVTTLVVACPKDLVMFQDALKTAGLEGKLVVKDIAELVEQAVGVAAESVSTATQ